MARSEVGCPDRLLHAVQRLDDRQHTALRLACVDRLRCAEIAARMGVTRAEVVTAIAQAMASLRRAIAPAPDASP